MTNHPNRADDGVAYVVEQVMVSPRGDTGSRYWNQYETRAEAVKEAKRIRDSLVFRTKLVAAYRDGKQVRNNAD